MADKPARMLAAERRQRILEMLSQRSAVLISDICEECGVSAVTARSDLDALEAEGKLKRTHGGAVPMSEYLTPPVSERMLANVVAKQTIGRTAAKLVSDGDMIIVGSGTTTFELAKALKGKRCVTVITNNCYIIDYAEKNLPEVTVISTGGVFGRDYRHFYGPIVAASLSDIYVDKAFVGAACFEPSFGFMSEYERTATAITELLRHARTSVVLMDSSKVGAKGSFIRYAKPEDVDVVVTERDPYGAIANALVEAGGRGRVIV